MLLRTLDAAHVLLPRRVAHERPARRRGVRQRRRRPHERARLAAQQLGDAAGVVEAEEDVRHEEAARRHVRPLVRKQHRRLEGGDGVVAEVTDDRFADRLRLLEGDEPRSGADEAVAAESSALDRLEQERRAGFLPQAEVRP